jgi:hypothetical protein
MNAEMITCGTDKSCGLGNTGHRRLEEHKAVGREAVRLPSPPSKGLLSMTSLWFYLSTQMFTPRSALFWDVTQCRLIVTNISGQPINPIFKGQLDCWPLNMTQIGHPKTSVMKYLSTMPNHREEGRPHLHHGSSLKSQCSRTSFSCFWSLTLSLLTWRIWWAPTYARKCQMGFNLVC